MSADHVDDSEGGNDNDYEFYLSSSSPLLNSSGCKYISYMKVIVIIIIMIVLTKIMTTIKMKTMTKSQKQ